MIPLHDDNPTSRFPFVTIILIAINAAVFFLWQMGTGFEQSINTAAFVPAEFERGAFEHLPNLFTSMFMHGGVMHLVGNMWFLWLFGNNIEDRCGHIGFVIFYLLCGVAATLGYSFFNSDSTIPLVGASGAISGVLGGYLITFPHAHVMTLVPLGFFSRIVALPAWIFLVIWIGFQFLSQAAMTGQEGSGGGVAFLAHIVGFVAGLVLVFVFRSRAATRFA
jgi:membrane associated rhomboid family serine protease